LEQAPGKSNGGGSCAAERIANGEAGRTDFDDGSDQSP
jgi:hypothetical protein